MGRFAETANALYRLSLPTKENELVFACHTGVASLFTYNWMLEDDLDLD